MSSDDDSPFPPYICTQAPPALLDALEDSTSSLQEGHGVLDDVFGKAVSGMSLQQPSQENMATIYLADEADEHADPSNFGEVFPDVNKAEPISSFDSADSIRSTEASALYKVDAGDCNETLSVLGLDQVCPDDTNNVTPLTEVCAKDGVDKQKRSDPVLSQMSDSPGNQDNISESKLINSETQIDNYQTGLKEAIKTSKASCETKLLTTKSDPLINIPCESKSDIVSGEKSSMDEVDENKNLSDIEKSNLEEVMENIENSVLDVIGGSGLSVENPSIMQENIDNDTQLSTDNDNSSKEILGRKETHLSLIKKKSDLEMDNVCDPSTNNTPRNRNVVGEGSGCTKISTCMEVAEDSPSVDGDNAPRAKESSPLDMEELNDQAKDSIDACKSSSVEDKSIGNEGPDNESSKLKTCTVDGLSGGNETQSHVDELPNLKDGTENQPICIDESKLLEDAPIHSEGNKDEGHPESDVNTDGYNGSIADVVIGVVAEAQVSQDGSVPTDINIDNHLVNDVKSPGNDVGVVELMNDTTAMSDVVIDSGNESVEIISDHSQRECLTPIIEQGSGTKEDSSGHKVCQEDDLKCDSNKAPVDESSAISKESETHKTRDTSENEPKFSPIYQHCDNKENDCEKSEDNAAGIVRIECDNQLLLIGIEKSPAENLISIVEDSCSSTRSVSQSSIDPAGISPDDIEEDTWKGPTLVEVTSVRVTDGTSEFVSENEEVYPDSCLSKDDSSSGIINSVSGITANSLPEMETCKLGVTSSDEKSQSNGKWKHSECDVKSSVQEKASAFSQSIKEKRRDSVDEEGKSTGNYIPLGNGSEKLLDPETESCVNMKQELSNESVALCILRQPTLKKPSPTPAGIQDYPSSSNKNQLTSHLLQESDHDASELAPNLSESIDTHGKIVKHGEKIEGVCKGSSNKLNKDGNDSKISPLLSGQGLYKNKKLNLPASSKITTIKLVKNVEKQGLSGIQKSNYMNAKTSELLVGKKSIHLAAGSSSAHIPEQTHSFVNKTFPAQHSSDASQLNAAKKIDTLGSSVLKTKPSGGQLCRTDNKVVKKISNGKISMNRSVGAIVMSPAQPLKLELVSQKRETSSPQSSVMNKNEKEKCSVDHSDKNMPAERPVKALSPHDTKSSVSRYLGSRSETVKTMKDHISTDTVLTGEKKQDNVERKTMDEKKVLDSIDKRRKQIDYESLEDFMQRYGISKSSSKESTSSKEKRETEKGVGKDEDKSINPKSSDKSAKSLVSNLDPAAGVKTAGKHKVIEHGIQVTKVNHSSSGEKRSVHLSSRNNVKSGLPQVEHTRESREVSFDPTDSLKDLAQKLGSYCSSVQTADMLSVNEMDSTLIPRKGSLGKNKISSGQMRKLSDDKVQTADNNATVCEQTKKQKASNSKIIKHDLNSKSLKMKDEQQTSSIEVRNALVDKAKHENLEGRIRQPTEQTDDTSPQHSTAREFSKILDPEVSLTKLFEGTLCDDTPVPVIPTEPVEEDLLELLEDRPSPVHESSLNEQTFVDSSENTEEKEAQELEISADSFDENCMPVKKRRRRLLDDIKPKTILKEQENSLNTPEKDTLNSDQSKTPTASSENKGYSEDEELSSVRRVAVLVPSKMRSAYDKELQKAERRLRYMKRKESFSESPQVALQDTPRKQLSPLNDETKIVKKTIGKRGSLKSTVVQLKPTNLNDSTSEKVDEQKKQSKANETMSVPDVHDKSHTLESNLKCTPPSSTPPAKQRKSKEKTPSSDGLRSAYVDKLRSSPRNTPSPLNPLKDSSVEKKSLKLSKMLGTNEITERLRDSAERKRRKLSSAVPTKTDDVGAGGDELSSQKRIPSISDKSPLPSSPVRHSTKRKLSSTDIEKSESEIIEEATFTPKNSASIQVNNRKGGRNTRHNASNFREDVPSNEGETIACNNILPPSLSLPPSLPVFTYKDLKRNVFDVKLPSSLWATQVETNGRFVSFTRMASNSNNTRVSMDKAVLFMGTCEPAVFFHERRLQIPVEVLCSLEEVSEFLHKIHCVAFCHGTGLPQATFAKHCLGYVDVSDLELRCSQCTLYRKKAIVLCEMQTLRQVQV